MSATKNTPVLIGIYTYIHMHNKYTYICIYIYIHIYIYSIYTYIYKYGIVLRINHRGNPAVELYSSLFPLEGMQKHTFVELPAKEAIKPNNTTKKNKQPTIKKKRSNTYPRAYYRVRYEATILHVREGYRIGSHFNPTPALDPFSRG